MMDVKCASGGVIHLATTTIANRISPDGLPLVRVSFQSEDSRQRWLAELIVEVAADERTERAAVRRKAARSVVAFGKFTAGEIRKLIIPPTIRSKSPPAGRYQVAFENDMSIGGLVRVARISCSMNGATSRASRLTPEMPEQAAWALERLAQEVHGAVTLSENVAIFGH